MSEQRCPECDEALKPPQNAGGAWMKNADCHMRGGEHYFPLVPVSSGPRGSLKWGYGHCVFCDAPRSDLG